MRDLCRPREVCRCSARVQNLIGGLSRWLSAGLNAPGARAQVREAKARGRPYTIVFVGVNGVGKSTNLAKVAYWLLQNGVSARSRSLAPLPLCLEPWVVAQSARSAGKGSGCCTHAACLLARVRVRAAQHMMTPSCNTFRGGVVEQSKTHAG